MSSSARRGAGPPLPRGGADDGDESARLEARPAHQGAVDVGLRDQRGGVVGLDAAAVEDAASIAASVRAEPAGTSARGGSRGPRRPGAGVAVAPCRWPRPARRRARSGAISSGATPAQPALELPLDHRRTSAPAAAPSAVSPTHSERRAARAAAPRATLRVDLLVGLAEELAPLGVPEDDERQPSVASIGGRDLAGEGALRLPVAVLRAERDAASPPAPRPPRPAP